MKISWFIAGLAVAGCAGTLAFAMPHPAGVNPTSPPAGKREFNPVEAMIRKQKIQKEIDELPIKVLLWMIGEWKP
jgi:hypothetical protein